MVHIDAATLRRYPILGILLGGVTAAIIGSLLGSGWRELRELLAQKSPEAVSLHEAVSRRGARWVTVSEGRWDCEDEWTTERHSVLERWIRGPVETTEVPIAGPIRGEILVASFDGGTECLDRAGSPLTGIVGSDEIFSGRAALRRWANSGDRVAILQVGARPQSALLMFIGLAVVFVVGLVMAGYYLTLLLRPGDRHPARTPSMEPIQPR